jgi:phospholipase/carboxylesterase
MRTMNSTEREFGGLRVVLTGGADGAGGGDGPLVVLLHGFGAPGRDLVPLAQFLAVSPTTRFAFPAAPLSLGLGADFGQGDFGLTDSRAWWHIDMQRLQRMMMQAGDFTALTTDVPAGLATARQQLLTALDELEQTLAVPSGQLVLGGFSQGAMLALDVALRSERRLAGLLLLSGTLICAGDWLPRLAGRRGLPLLQSHGQQDGVLPFALATQLRDQLLLAGVAVEFVPFAGGHEIPPVVLKAGSRFLQQVLR